MRYLDDKKRKNKLKKQGLWEEVQRRERLDEEQEAAGFGGEDRGNGATGGGGGGGRQRGSGGGGEGGEGGGGGQNWGMLGRPDVDEGSEFPQKERIRCAQFGAVSLCIAFLPALHDSFSNYQCVPFGGLLHASLPSCRASMPVFFACVFSGTLCITQFLSTA